MMRQKKLVNNLVITALIFVFFQRASAGKIVDFNANSITSPISVLTSFNLDTTTPSIDAILSDAYTGPAIYSSFNETAGGKSFWSAHNPNNSGLKLRWNPNTGISGDFASALFLFKKSEFLNGFNQSTVKMDVSNDSIFLKTGYLNLGSVQNGSPIERATIRIVVKNDLGYFISSPLIAESSQSLFIEATELVFFTYDPFNQSGQGAGSIGNQSNPDFNNIESIGFRLDALRGENTASGVNFGIIEFSANARSQSTEINLDLNVATRLQQIEGFGASGAWYENLLSNHNDKADLMELLFSDLSLDIYRLRNVYNHNNLDYVNKIAQDASIIASGEAALGRPLKILLSAWSPPAYLKSTGDTRNGGTLASDSNGEYRYNDYAQWWYSSLNYYASSGIDIFPDYISIQNEPNWVADHESNILAVPESATEAAYNTAFEAVWNKLNTRMGASMPKMIGPETVGLRVADQYIDSLTNPGHMYGYAHHLYQQDVGANPDVLLDDMADFQADYSNKPIFQTEYFNSDSATPWLRAYNLAKLMHNALTVEGVSAYFYWGLYWKGEQGLINLPDRNSYSITPEYYAFKHFSRFVNAGWQRFETHNSQSGLHTSAYVNPDNSSVSVIILSELTEQVEFWPVLEGYTIDSVQAYRTTQTENFANLGNLDLSAAVVIEPYSITTLSLAITASNRAPEVTILTPNEAAVPSGSGLMLEAQVSDDAYPNTSMPSTLWTSLNTPTGGNVIFDSQTSLNTGVTFDLPGSYQLQLSANDGERIASKSILVHYRATESINRYASLDIGSVGLSGSSAVNNDSITISGSGSDIWGSRDAFHFHYKTLGQDGSLVARLTNQGNSNSWAKSGLMIRDSLEPDSSYAFIAKTPGYGTVFQYRSLAGENSLTQNVNLQTLPQWLKIERSGINIITYTSTNGTDWQKAGTISPDMADSNYIGFATTSHNNEALSQAVFDNISNNISNIGPEISTGNIRNATINTATLLNASVVDDGQPDNTAPTVNWSQIQGPGEVNFGNPNSSQTTFSGDTIGTYSLRLVADDGVIRTFNTLDLSVHSAWKGWQINYFGDPNSSFADALADPNGNGLQNIFEYALGGHPTKKINAADILPTYSFVDNSDGRHLSLTYRRRSGSGIGNAASGYNIDGITYYVQTNNSLNDSDWNTVLNELVEVGNPLYHGDGTESVTVRMQEPIDSSAKPSAFMRLKVESSE